MNSLRIGVIGLGWFGEIHCETILGVPNLELTALCTRRPERLKSQAEKFGVKKTYRDYRDMLADPDIDAVSIVTMWDQHTDLAVAALEDHRGIEESQGHFADRAYLPVQSALSNGKTSH
jgi:UDP-N-acetylglucosamine 3-dehydrogenase